MSKERKFHEWIEQQDREEKNRVWETICEREGGEVRTQPEAATPKKARSFSWKKWAAVAASVLIVFLGVFSIVKFLPFGEQMPENEDRYFTEQAYDTLQTDKTLKAYAEELGKEILYFDWYAETDYLKDSVWNLKDTGETICYNEEIVDVETGCLVYLFAVLNDVELASFVEDENIKYSTQVNGITVNWDMGDDIAWANFEYKDYKYYLRIFEPIDENYVLSLVEELLT